MMVMTEADLVGGGRLCLCCSACDLWEFVSRARKWKTKQELASTVLLTSETLKLGFLCNSWPVSFNASASCWIYCYYLQLTHTYDPSVIFVFMFFSAKLLTHLAPTPSFFANSNSWSNYHLLLFFFLHGKKKNNMYIISSSFDRTHGLVTTHVRRRPIP